jgi:hypothetical protein
MPRAFRTVVDEAVRFEDSWLMKAELTAIIEEAPK